MGDYGDGDINGGGIMTNYQVVIKQRGKQIDVKQVVADSALLAIEIIEKLFKKANVQIDEQIVQWTGLEFEARASDYGGGGMD